MLRAGTRYARSVIFRAKRGSSGRAGGCETTGRATGWRSFAAYFVAEKSAGLQVNSHVEKLSQSVCKRSSGDRLWCGSCHDPHTVPAPAERAAWYRSRCLTCHATAECDRGFDCTSCHMLKNRAIDAGHGVFTDHSIPRVAARAATGAPAKAPAQGAADSWQLAGSPR